MERQESRGVRTIKCVELDSKSLYGAFTSGGHQLIRKREEINRINVFPVADGDTGTNLALTLDSLIHNTEVHQTAGETLTSMAEAVLSGARGNSGFIFAEFIVGLSEFLQRLERITLDDFDRALKNAVRKAYEAIYNPVEGTILTVIRDWAHSIGEYKHLGDFSAVFRKTLKRAKKSLDNTPNLLPVLKDAHVVDAGAEGFFEFLRRVTKFFVSGETVAVPEDTKIYRELHAEMHGGEYPVFRYCTEGFIRGGDMDTGAIRDELQRLGDSLIVAGGADMARVHIHTDNPAEVFRKLGTRGDIVEQKVDDMVREYEVTHARKHPIALVTDSVCDLPGQLIDRYQIHVLPMNIQFEGARYIDGITIKSSDIYDRIDTVSPYPSTSQPSPASFRLLYSFLTTYYESVIAIHVSGKLSGTFSVSRKEALNFPDKKITVIDSRNNSGSQALIVLRAAEAIAEGKSHEEVVEEIESSIEKANIFVSVPSLKYMVKGGRVSPLKGFVARVLNLTPVVSLDEEGSAHMLGKAFSRRQNRRMLLKIARDIAEKGPVRYYGIVHARNEEGASSFARQLEGIIGKAPLFIQEISPIMGLHAGKGCYAMVVMRE